jgi:hypothetical protein
MWRSCGSNLRVALYHIIDVESFLWWEIGKCGNVFTAPLFHLQTQITIENRHIKNILSPFDIFFFGFSVPGKEKLHTTVHRLQMNNQFFSFECLSLPHDSIDFIQIKKVSVLYWSASLHVFVWQIL